MLASEDTRINEPPAISPDGLRIAFVATGKNGKTALWVRALNSSDPRQLSGTENATQPFWSPDSRSVAFFANGKLMKTDLSADSPQTLCDVSDPRGAAWSKDGVILFAPHPGDALYQVSASGGNATRVTSLDPTTGQTSHRWPSFLPDGVHFLFFAWSARKETTGIYVGSLDSKEIKLLLRSEHGGVYAPPGYLLFQRTGMLMAQQFDAAKTQLSGEPIPIAEDVWFDTTFSGGKGMTASNNQVLAFVKGTLLSEIVSFDRQGKQIASLGAPAAYGGVLALSRDGKRMAVPIGISIFDIWLYDLSSGNSSRFTFDPADDFDSIWSPDESHIVFSSSRTGPYQLYYKSSSGMGSEEQILHTANWDRPNDWSHDGRYLLYEETDPKTRLDLWVLPMQGDRKPFPFLKSDANEAQAKFSPDGRWIAYCSDESGRPEVYVQPFLTQVKGKWQVSTNGGLLPKWRRDGKELFYISDGKVMSTEIKTDSTFEAGQPTALFPLKVLNVILAGGTSYEVTADGQRFFLTRPVILNQPSSISVLFNWTALLKK